MTTDPFIHDDAAYVLDALSPQERAVFEAHLETCPDCQARVSEARAAAELLTGLTLADVADPGPVPDTLLPGLLRRAGREQTRRRLLTGSIGAVAAACITALVVVLWPGGGSTPSSPAQALVPVRPSPVTATATLVSKAWGTEIDLHCKYSDTVERWEPYKLVVVDDRGGQHDAGSWTLAAGHEVDFTSGTAVREADISRVEITLEDGSPILQLSV
jgi:anti-sigma factor RsiW